MEWLGYALAGLFLPLYPLSIIPNAVLARLQPVPARVAALLVWAVIAGLLLVSFDDAVPKVIAWWGVLTALLYALRLLTVRDVGVWTGFALSSPLALLWLIGATGGGVVDGFQLVLLPVAIALPLVVVVLLAALLTERFGAAYAGLYRGLGMVMPRFSLLLVIAVLAAMATPFFPSFSALVLAMLGAPSLSLVVVVALVWLLLSWAAINLLRGLVFGTPRHDGLVLDLAPAQAWSYLVLLSLALVVGVYVMSAVL